MIKKISLPALVIGMIIFSPGHTFAGILAGWDVDTGNVFEVEEVTGVYCEINGVRLFAQSGEDCAKAGGIVTHTVTKKGKSCG